ncbi:hypothetical protein GGS20DRAFT_583366 [Poronia punctata]|nr:hypothetical protein GGS20DRAFT_583366 [Poronia punctata]
MDSQPSQAAGGPSAAMPASDSERFVKTLQLLLLRDMVPTLEITLRALVVEKCSQLTLEVLRLSPANTNNNNPFSLSVEEVRQAIPTIPYSGSLADFANVIKTIALGFFNERCVIRVPENEQRVLGQEMEHLGKAVVKRALGRAREHMVTLLTGIEEPEEEQDEEEEEEEEEEEVVDDDEGSDSDYEEGRARDKGKGKARGKGKGKGKEMEKPEPQQQQQQQQQQEQQQEHEHEQQAPTNAAADVVAPFVPPADPAEGVTAGALLDVTIQVLEAPRRTPLPTIGPRLRGEIFSGWGLGGGGARVSNTTGIGPPPVPSRRPRGRPRRPTRGRRGARARGGRGTRGGAARGAGGVGEGAGGVGEGAGGVEGEVNGVGRTGAPGSTDTPGPGQA